MKQIKALSDQFATIEVANGHRRQPTPHFVDEDDVITFSGAQSQQRNIWFNTRSSRQANLTVIRDPQIHLPNPTYVEKEDEFVDEEFQEYEFIDQEFKHGDVMKMLKILHKDSWIGILHQPMIVISMMKIL